MKLTVFEKGFNFSQDGPGNRLVLHAQGCNLRCPWCANPEGMPAQAPAGFSGDARTPEAWFEYVQTASPMFFSGGGLTLTGGEVCVQLDAAQTLLSLCRGAGIHTAIESNMSMPRMSTLFPSLDLLIADYKHPNAVALRNATGAELAVVERNFSLAMASGLPVIARIPLIGGFNADERWALGFAAALARIAAKGAPGQLSVELLRYHEYGREKWARCGLPYTVRNGRVSPDTMVMFRHVLAGAGINVIST